MDIGSSKRAIIRAPLRFEYLKGSLAGESGDNQDKKREIQVRRNSVTETQGEDGDIVYRVAVTVVPEGGKANEAVIKLLPKHLGVAKSKFTLVSGARNRDKVFEWEP